MRLHRIGKEYEERVTLRTRFFPLELLRPGGPSRPLLEQEWWLAAIQEPAAAFAPYPVSDWPTTTLPAFDAAWAAMNQGHAIGMDYDLRVRRAFFGEGRNIGRRIRAHRIVGMAPLECVGEGCSDAVRALFERALTGEKR